ncbi:N-acyl-D-amino-acid deacylase family protein [Humisphaera borealis]|uniref:D-aminoacylase n=1 Tax=Humisphaera borealis TaxID=2807512 RepID=A0A7M2WTB0_9BACT|nr:D-aminoacylase [Humisphaera borealis]QOV88748.1 D-aminoacylase [Humisphaera borealis]
MPHLLAWACLAGLIAVIAGCQASTDRYDLIVRNGRIADGSGKPAYRADVAIRGGRIAAIGAFPEDAAPVSIDATGKIVAPGFIDVHTHVDGDIHDAPAAEHFVRDGVTTIVSGNCGGSVKDVAAYFDRISKRGTGLNVATLYGHNTVLRTVKGDRKGELSPEQLASAKELVRQAMRDGAVGLSTGLIYNPGQFSSTEEIIALAAVAGEAGGIYASHMRNESGGILGAIDEAVRVGREAKVPVQISHFKLPSSAAKKVGGADATLGRVNEARKTGLEIGIDQYPYTASSTSISTLIPDAYLEQGIANARSGLKDPKTYEEVLKAMLEHHGKKQGRTSLSYVVVAYAESSPQYNGKNMVQIAEWIRSHQKGTNVELLRDVTKPLPEVTFEDQCRAVLDVFKSDNASCVFHTMDDAEVERIMADPTVAIASDSGLRQFGVGVPHPRGYGTNARVLGRYAREKKLFTIEEAVRKMTSLPAATFRFADRGTIKEGFVADLAIFDPATVIDAATFEKPHQYSLGITDVIVNGVPVLRDGQMTGKLPGRPVLGPGAKPTK